MKSTCICLAWMLLLSQSAVSQTQKDAPLHLFQIYEDNDFINLFGKWTDDAYTNGTSLRFFSVQNKTGRLSPDRIFPKAGKGSMDISWFGLTQLMYTPYDLESDQFQFHDYPYSGALFLTHGIYSYNPVEKWAVKSGVQLGVEGPDAMAKQAQTLMHHILSYPVPRGWQYQGRNKILFNGDIELEKQVLSAGKWLEWMAGAQLSAGNFLNSLALETEIRIGKMSPYFTGYISQFAGKSFYFFLKPSVSYVLSSSLLQEKRTARVQNEIEQEAIKDSISDKEAPLQHWVASLHTGAVLTFGKLGFSLSQNFSNPLLKGLYRHAFGNVSVYYNW